MKQKSFKLLFFLTFYTCSTHAAAQERLRMATTTSTENSGLLAVLNPIFEKKYNIELDVIAVGTGKALKLGENGDVDLILAHAPEAEMRFVESEYGVDRKAVMHNDFVILGPQSDPAEVKNAESSVDALRLIMQGGADFISRGDDSGTHKKELSLWKMAELDPQGEWYLAVGQGMGAVLKIANDKRAYTLIDRGTWLAYQNKTSLVIVSEGDPMLFNPYHVIMINPEKHPHVKFQLASQYSAFITGVEGQKIIQDYKVNGEVLFHPDVLPEENQLNSPIDEKETISTSY